MINQSGLITIGDKKPIGKTGYFYQVIRYSGVDKFTSSPGAHPDDSFVKLIDADGYCIDHLLSVTSARKRAHRLVQAKID